MSRSLHFSVLLVVFLCIASLDVEAQICEPSGTIKGTKPPKECSKRNLSTCCVEGQVYSTYDCSPPVTSHTTAQLTLRTFGNHPCQCDGLYRSDDLLIVALSTGWFEDYDRCLRKITISANGKNVAAEVLDECDSSKGCDKDHAYQPPCANNVVGASSAVWKALGVSRDKWGGGLNSLEISKIDHRDDQNLTHPRIEYSIEIL
ncbi:hypothetical protein RJ640_000826 [Escallonia rubra]|uniref:Ripening-related protein 1 n=1 Tax=Escallonia rubra TaxID=112253 RepID=A0AA88QI40_9ASTE|nr:hypothetical protein RJ640_000826 [Escallonia rubra]